MDLADNNNNNNYAYINTNQNDNAIITSFTVNEIFGSDTKCQSGGLRKYRSIKKNRKKNNNKNIKSCKNKH